MGRLIDRTSSRLLPRRWLASRFDPIFSDGLSRQWLRMNIEAYRRFRGIRPRDMTHLGLFSFSRGGSHLFQSSLHAVPCCFCFGEGSINIETDLNWRTFLCRGMYHFDSIQDKSLTSITHLVYNNNNSPVHLDRRDWREDEMSGYRRKWILVLRNPLRILLSQNATRKQKWRLTEEWACQFSDWFEKSRRRFLELLAHKPKDTLVVCIEKFAAGPGETLAEVASQLDLDAKQLARSVRPVEFFRLLGRTGEKPVVRDGVLTSPTRDLPVGGWGGGFNPLVEPDPDRLYRDDLAANIPKEILIVLKARLGNAVVEYFMNDRAHRFTDRPATSLLEL